LAHDRAAYRNRLLTEVSYVRDFGVRTDSSGTSGLQYDYLKQEYKNSILFYGIALSVEVIPAGICSRYSFMPESKGSICM
jgi:hypothetical protein